jgi:hypothetical protein
MRSVRFQGRKSFSSVYAPKHYTQASLSWHVAGEEHTDYRVVPAEAETAGA